MFNFCSHSMSLFLVRFRSFCRTIARKKVSRLTTAPECHDATDLELHLVDLAAFIAGLDRLAHRFLLLRLEGLRDRLHIDFATRRADDSRLGRLLSFCLQLLNLRFETLDLSARFGSLGLERLVGALRGFELWTWGVSGCANGLECCRIYLLLQFFLGVKRSSLFRHRIGGSGSQLVHLSTQARNALFVSLTLVHRLLQAGDQALSGIELTLSSARKVIDPFSRSLSNTNAPERGPSPTRSPAEDVTLMPYRLPCSMKPNAPRLSPLQPSSAPRHSWSPSLPSPKLDSALSPCERGENSGSVRGT